MEESGAFGKFLAGSSAARFFMFVEKRHAGESPGAGLALVLLHIGMGLQVSAEVRPVGKSSVAVCAGERFLTWGGKSKEQSNTNAKRRITASC